MKIIYHSHIDVGAYFSPTDQAAAQMDGEPSYPVEYVVIDVQKDGPRGAAQFCWSDADKKYVAHWCDTYGGKFSAVGHGKRSGDSIEFVFQYPDGPFYNTFTWNAKAKGWTFRMESQGKDSKRVLFAEDTLRRP